MGSSRRKARTLKQKATSFKLQGLSKEQQQAFGFALLSVVLVVRGGMFLFNPQLATLECDRRQSLGMCKLTLSSLHNETITPFPLDRLQRADRQSFGKLSQLVVQTSDGPLYFPTNYGFNSTQDYADQVNAFVRDTTAQSLKLKQDNRWFAYSVASGSIVIVSFWLWVSLKRLFDCLTRQSQT
jgi:hypothetical protein